ncbi:hypothetical protein DB347_19505 [Opitutaceae bacterium EW11]|nr:hypothetical protein DB347_19505 [Opitutaceae bacterium EW11]
MLIIFDVDGTLLGGETADWGSFDSALKTVLGFDHTPGFFSALHDVTAESIAEAAILATGRRLDDGLVREIREAYLGNLQEAHRSSAAAFTARRNVSALLRHLASLGGVTVAVATGDWRPTISFKLRCAGVEVSHLPMATASDARRRAEIIALAATRAGRNLSDAIYVGDGAWDLRACRDLGIPFIGTGSRTEKLVELGAEHICEDLEPEPFVRLARRFADVRRTSKNAGAVSRS